MTDLCFEIHHLFARLPHHHFPFDPEQIPLNGIYILYEDGETAHETDRIVRIGTHNGNNRLPLRLNEHFVKENKDRSIFRKNIGRALLNKAQDPFLGQWEHDLMSRHAREEYRLVVDMEKQKKVERLVTAYIQFYFRFTVFPVQNKEERLLWESRIISTVWLCQECKPSPGWLGLFSPKKKIRESGLWIVNELYKQPLNPSEFDSLRKVVERS